MKAEPTKRCPRCHAVKPWCNYTARTRWPDGSVRSVQGHCQACNAELCREWRQRVGERPETRRARQNRWVRGLDPERKAIRADKNREGMRRKNGTTPDRYRTRTAPQHGGPTVPAGPFREWLLSLDETHAELSFNTGLPERRIRSVVKGEQDRIEFDTVDRALLHYGEPWLLDDLYPMEEAA